MQNLVLKNWETAETFKGGQGVQIETATPRGVKFEGVTSGKTLIVLAKKGRKEGTLVMVADGAFRCEFTAPAGVTEIRFDAPQDVKITVSDIARDHRVIARANIPSFTSLAPRPATDPRFEEMRRLMLANQQYMQQQLQAAHEAYQAAIQNGVKDAGQAESNTAADTAGESTVAAETVEPAADADKQPTS